MPTPEEVARKLHEWYLEAVAWLRRDGDLHGENYNTQAYKNYDDLTQEQKFLDQYIAQKGLELIDTARQEGFNECVEIIKSIDPLEAVADWNDSQDIAYAVKDHILSKLKTEGERC